jgi:hypothetical protein
MEGKYMAKSDIELRSEYLAYILNRCPYEYEDIPEDKPLSFGEFKKLKELKQYEIGIW